jgi:hypothetical protein
MKRDELQNIWHRGSSNIETQSVDELNMMLEQRVARVMRKHFFINYISVSVGLTLIALLIYSGIKKSYDTYYLINNIVLCFITAMFVAFGIWSWYKMNYNPIGLSLKDWIKYRINELSKSQKRYPVRYLFAVLVILPYYLSFFVYFINRPFIEVIYSEQFYTSFLIVFFSGSFSALFAIRNIKTYNQKNLKKLKKLYNELE